MPTLDPAGSSWKITTTVLSKLKATTEHPPLMKQLFHNVKLSLEYWESILQGSKKSTTELFCEQALLLRGHGNLVFLTDGDICTICDFWWFSNLLVILWVVRVNTFEGNREKILWQPCSAQSEWMFVFLHVIMSDNRTWRIRKKKGSKY